jgi:Protein of unknown function (DUF3108)
MIALTALAALALGAAPACGLPPPRDAPLPFRTGETLSYDIDVMGVVKAGSASVAVEPPIMNGSLLPLRARFRNTSVFAKVRKARGYALSWVDPRTLRPQRYRDESEEDGVRKSTDTRLDRPGPVTMAWVLGERKGTASMQRQGDVLDLLSAVYYLRAARVEPGAAICFDLVANRRFWRLRGEVAPKPERVESAAGIFDTLRLDATLTRADGQGPPRPVHLWFSRDARRLPVAAVSEIDLGPVRAMLSSVAAPSAEPTD